MPDQGEVRDALAHWDARLQRAMDQHPPAVGGSGWTGPGASPFLQSPLRSIQEKRLLLDYQQQRLVHGMERQVQAGRERAGPPGGLPGGPEPVPGAGAGVLPSPRKEDGTVLSSIEQVSAGEGLSLRLADGLVTCTATGKEKHRWRKRN